MLTKKTFLPLAAFLLGVLTLAQPILGADTTPATPAAAPAAPAASALVAGRRGGAPGLVSPEVHPDHTVTFRVRMPNAQAVSITGADWTDLGVEIPMTKDETGVWSVTVGPLDPMYAIYNFTIDGVTTPDLNNPRVKRRTNRGSPGSFLYVPGNPPEFWEARDVPHGTVEANWAKSAATGDTRFYYVYTPPGYEVNGTTKYPILYLFHGSNGTQDDWTDAGKANFIEDNLIAEGEAVPMIIVMPWGHAVVGPQAGTNNAVFERYLLEEVMPAVEKKYHVAPGRENRAIVGLSMGGGQSLNIGLSHLDLFASVGGFSYAFSAAQLQNNFADLLNDPAGTNAKLKVLWLGVGRQDKTVGYANNKQVSDILYDHGINHVFFDMDGAHTFAVWRKCLAEVLPVLFNPSAVMPTKAVAMAAPALPPATSAPATAVDPADLVAHYRGGPATPADITEMAKLSELPVLTPGAGEGDFLVKPPYAPAPEQTPRANVPKGKVVKFTMQMADSKFYPDTGLRDWKPTRDVTVYIPSQYVAGTPAPLLLTHDAMGAARNQLATILDNLIADHRLPVMVAVMVANGGGDARGSERGLEYDTVSGKFAEFIEAEVLPRVTKETGVTFTKDPEGRATMGGSSGGAEAFTMAWFHPELYHRVLTYSGTYTNNETPKDPKLPNGAWEYHEHLIPQNPAKPLRIWLEAGSNDNGSTNTAADLHNWVIANERMAGVLKAKGYHYQFVYAEGAGHVDGKVVAQTLPHALEWLWQGYQPAK